MHAARRNRLHIRLGGCALGCGLVAIAVAAVVIAYWWLL